jgi:hypothetical protein
VRSLVQKQRVVLLLYRSAHWILERFAYRFTTAEQQSDQQCKMQ